MQKQLIRVPATILAALVLSLMIGHTTWNETGFHMKFPWAIPGFWAAVVGLALVWFNHTPVERRTGAVLIVVGMLIMEVAKHY